MEAARRRFIGGNWKSNLTFADAKKLVTDVLNKAEFNTSKVEVVVAPVMIHIPWVLSSLDSKIKVSAQNASKTKMGAFTGEVTAQHLKDFGLEWVIIGHSERRTLYGETD